MNFPTHFGLVPFFYQYEGMLLLSLRPSTTSVWLEIAVSYFPELPLWVDVESSLKNSTSHFFVFPETGHWKGKCCLVKQSNCLWNVWAAPPSGLETFAANNKVVTFSYHWTLLNFLCNCIYIPIKNNSFLYHSTCRNTRCFIEQMFVLGTSFINVTNPALTHACWKPQGHRYICLKEDGKGLNVWRVNALNARLHTQNGVYS